MTIRTLTLAAGLALAAGLLGAAAQVAPVPAAAAAGYLPAHFTVQGEIEPHPPQF